MHLQKFDQSQKKPDFQ